MAVHTAQFRLNLLYCDQESPTIAKTLYSKGPWKTRECLTHVPMPRMERSVQTLNDATEPVTTGLEAPWQVWGLRENGK